MSITHYPVYHGKKSVSLGAMSRGYISELMKWVNDPAATRGVSLQPPVTLEAEMAWYDKVSAGSKTDAVFAVLLHDKKATGGYRYIGHTGLHYINQPLGTAHSGSLIGGLDVQGKGHGTEAKMLLLHHAFHALGLRKVCSELKASNGNSWGHLLKCGYRAIGRRRAQHFDNGEFVDEVILEVFRNEWEPLWAEYQKSGELPQLTDEQRAMLKEEIRE